MTRNIKEPYPMKINQIASNMTELKTHCATVLFSYQTPVAGYDAQGPFRTDCKYSVTTTKHINKYLGGATVGREVSQEFINELCQ